LQLVLTMAEPESGNDLVRSMEEKLVLKIECIICFLLLTFHTGELVSTLNKHKGPIISLKWNKKGDYLLSGSFDTTAVVWNVKSGKSKQQFDFHSGVLLPLFCLNYSLYFTSYLSKDRFCFVLLMFSVLLYNPMQVHCLMLLGETIILLRPAPLIT